MVIFARKQFHLVPRTTGLILLDIFLQFYRKTYSFIVLAVEVRPFPILTTPPRHRMYQRKYIYIEHRAGKVARLASWRKMTQPADFCW
jgi:hypothetical protein